MTICCSGAPLRHLTHSRPSASSRPRAERPGGLPLLPISELRRLVAAMVD